MTNVTVYEGENVTITCVVMSKSARPRYIQWMVVNEKNNSFEILETVLFNGGNLQDYGDNLYATTLQLQNVGRENDREYFCKAEGASGGYDYQKVWVTMLPKPKPTDIMPEPIISKYCGVIILHF